MCLYQLAVNYDFVGADIREVVGGDAFFLFALHARSPCFHSVVEVSEDGLLEMLMKGEEGCLEGLVLRVERGAMNCHDDQVGYEGLRKVDGAEGQELRGGAKDLHWFVVVHDGEDLPDGIKSVGNLIVLVDPGW